MSLTKAHQILNYAYATARYGRQIAKQLDDDFVRQVNTMAQHGGAVLGANAPINQIKGMGGIAEAVTSPLDFAGRAYRGEGVVNSLKASYMKDAIDKNGKAIKELDLGNIAGTAVAGSLGLSVVGGLTHDTAGNVDIAGIPGI